jgi:hypothetical protein
MKKRLLLFALTVLCLFTARAATPDWKWLKVGSGTIVSGNSIATDASGNSYITGNFQSIIGFGTTYLTALKANSIYIAKFDNTGKMLWVKQADNTKYGAMNSVGIALDGSGNCYIAGSFTYTVVFDTTHLTTTATNSANSDIFIAKYDKDGNFVWVQHPVHASAYGYDNAATGITIDGSNLITVTGTCSGKVDYGNSITFTGGFHATFIAQFDVDGKAKWAKHFWDKNSVGVTSSTGITSDKDGNLLLCGNGNGQVTDLGGTSTFNLYGGYFVAKYDKTGAYIWAKIANGPQVSAISVDGSGNPAITGYFGSTAQFDASTTISSYGGYDLFAAKYDKDGNLKWVQKIGTKNDDKGASSILQDGSGNVYISGTAGPGAAFGSLSIPAETKIPNYGYVAKYDNSGTVQWLQNVTLKSGAVASNSTFVYDLAMDGNGNIYATGNTAPSTMFGTFESGGYGTFIAMIGSGTTPAPPAAPTNLTASPQKKKADGKILLSWKDNATNETGFIIFRGTDSTNWVAIDSVAADVVSYLDSNLANTTKFYYKVAAYNGSGVSSATNVVSATTFENGLAPEQVSQDLLLVYPNPSQNIFTIQLPATRENVEIRVQNVMGQVIYERITAGMGSEYSIELPQSVKGLVLIAVKVNNLVYNEKQLIQ